MTMERKIDNLKGWFVEVGYLYFVVILIVVGAFAIRAMSPLVFQSGTLRIAQAAPPGYPLGGE